MSAPAADPAPTPGDDTPAGAASVPAFVDPDASGVSPLMHELDAVLAELHDRGPAPDLRTDLTELLCAWAASLISLQRTRVDADCRVATIPWVLSGDPLPEWLARLPAVAGRAWAVRQHPVTLGSIARARADWRTTHWMHGTAGDDVVLSRATPDSPVRGHLVAGEAIGCGDPRWDVASALDWLAVTLTPALEPAWGLDPVVGFLTAYRTLGGTSEPPRALAIARTIMTAVEWSAQLTSETEPPSDEDLSWLSALWSRPLDLVCGTARRPTTSSP